jgi:predicted dinucleotide-binding enzyme
MVAGVAEALRGAEVVLLASPWEAVPEALRAAGPLAGVVLIDATNPFGPGFTMQAGPRGESGGEQVQALVPRARVVKAFNSTGFANMADPLYEGASTVMPYAGDDASAKATVRRLVADLGFDPVDAGPLARSRQLEHLAMLWIALAMGIGTAPLGRDIAFRIVRR